MKLTLQYSLIHWVKFYPDLHVELIENYKTSSVSTKLTANALGMVESHEG